MKRIFEYTKKSEMEKLTPDQREFMAKMIVREVQRKAKELDLSEEIVYEMYSKGLFGADRILG